MKRRTVLTLIAGLALVAGQLVAQPGPGMKGKMHGGPKMDCQGPMGQAERSPLPFLNLTDEQEAKFQTLMLQHQKEMIPLHTELQKQEANLDLELTADKFDAAKVKSIQAEISKVQGELLSKRVAHQRTIRDLLTPEQRVEFDRHLLDRKGKGGPGHMGGPGGGHRMGRGMQQGPQ